VLAAAITKQGNVVIAGGGLEPVPSEFGGFKTNDPTRAFLGLPGCRIGLPLVEKDVHRVFAPEQEFRPSIALAAAEAFDVKVDPHPNSARWVAYYGDAGTLTPEKYTVALDRPRGYFKGRAVFIGGKPQVKNLVEASDEFGTPFTRWTGNKMRGVEILATMFLNLIHNQCLTRLGAVNEAIAILLVGLVFSWMFTLFRPVPGLILAALGVGGVSLAAILLYWTQRIWFNWMLIGWVEIPVAWGACALIYSRKLSREKEKVDRENESLIKELDSYKSAEHARTAAATSAELAAAHALADLKAVTAIDAPSIPDYNLVKKIDEGAYGQVWLARDLTDVYQAVKIIYRKNFSEQRPFEREFEGVKNFVTFSRSHPGCVNVRHVGKDKVGGFFYYVMEPADDLVRGTNIDPTQYVPRTLSKLIVENRVLPVIECVDLGIEVASALAALHGHRLVHRDVKPANIIFANNKPRLADIGLVARMDEKLSINGTEGYMPDDHLGTPVADVFSLGRVLYVASTGCPATRHPELPTALGERKDARDLMRLMDIINKACATRYEDRYQSAAEMRDDLQKLRTRLSTART
jgi:hypothetical protein